MPHLFILSSWFRMTSVCLSMCPINSSNSFSIATNAEYANGFPFLVSFHNCTLKGITYTIPAHRLLPSSLLFFPAQSRTASFEWRET